MEIEDDENLSLYSSAIPGGSKLEKKPHEIIEEIAAATTESEKIEGEVGEDDDQIVPEIKEWIRVEHNPTPFVLMSQPEEEDSEDESDQEENWYGIFYLSEKILISRFFKKIFYFLFAILLFQDFFNVCDHGPIFCMELKKLKLKNYFYIFF